MNQKNKYIDNTLLRNKSSLSGLLLFFLKKFLIFIKLFGNLIRLYKRKEVKKEI